MIFGYNCHLCCKLYPILGKKRSDFYTLSQTKLSENYTFHSDTDLPSPSVLLYCVGAEVKTSLFTIGSKLIRKGDGVSLSSSRFCRFVILSIFVSLPIVFLCPVGPSCRLYGCLGNWRFRYLLASILLGDLDIQMVPHVFIRVGHARTHVSQVTPLW